MPIKRFTWKYSIVEPTTLYGSFNNWGYGIGMHHDKETNTMICDTIIEPGTYTYKFKVGDDWFYDIENPTAIDPNGNVNNLITILDDNLNANIDANIDAVMDM